MTAAPPHPWLTLEEYPSAAATRGLIRLLAAGGELDPAANPIQVGTLHRGSRNEKKASVAFGLSQRAGLYFS